LKARRTGAAIDTIHHSDRPPSLRQPIPDSVRLALSEESLRLATEAGGIGTWDFDLTTDILTWSDRTKAMFGISPDRVCTMADFYAGLHPEDRDATAAAFASALDPAIRATYDVEYRAVGKEDGVVRWVAARGGALFADDGSCIRALGTAIDITGRRAEAERLRASEARLADSEAFAQLLLESTSEAFYSVDATGLTTLCNPAFVRLLGFASMHDAVGRRLHDVIHHSRPDGSPYPVGDCPIYRAASTGRAAHVLDELFYRLDGTPVAVEYRAEPLLHDGVAAGAIVTIRDVTEARAATAALRELNESLETRVAERTRERDRTWANSQDLLLVIDGDGTILSVNPAWTTLLDWTPAELLGRRFFDFLHPNDIPITDAALEVARVEHLPNVENRYRHRDGSYRNISWVATPEGGVIYASGRNVTAEKAAAAELAVAQDALRQAQKMEAVGQLTGGIAHDFNNLLQIVVGNLDLLQRALPADPPRLRRAAVNALARAMRAATLTQRLMAFSRRQPLVATAIEVNALVGGMSELVGRSLGETITIDLVLDPAAGRVEVDPNQLESAILNLAVNARDAMPGGGVLTIGTSTRVIAAAAAAIPVGTYVVITVSDIGTGMDAATAARVFEPFFTTKEVGKGTGLGLAMVYGFVKQSRGHVALASEPGVGTTVDIFLPAFSGTLPEAVVVATVAAATRRATILVVEDDAAVCAAAVEMLGELGHAAITAADGPEAMAILGQLGADIDLLFTDVVLPSGMTGVDLARVAAAAAAVPGLRVLFTTGYARSAFDDSNLTGAILPKPYTVADLAAQVAASLG
jgi:PAS domain S-box-containing protein